MYSTAGWDRSLLVLLTATRMAEGLLFIPQQRERNWQTYVLWYHPIYFQMKGVCCWYVSGGCCRVNRSCFVWKLKYRISVNFRWSKCDLLPQRPCKSYLIVTSIFHSKFTESSIKTSVPLLLIKKKRQTTKNNLWPFHTEKYRACSSHALDTHSAWFISNGHDLIRYTNTWIT